MKTPAEVVAVVNQHTVGNRKAIEASKYAGCVSCCATFDAKQVRSWRDEWASARQQNRVKRWTAECPRCGKPTIIGSSTGMLDDQGYLPIVNNMLASS